jgi:hypothetical protein
LLVLLFCIVWFTNSHHTQLRFLLLFQLLGQHEYNQHVPPYQSVVHGAQQIQGMMLAEVYRKYATICHSTAILVVLFRR